MAKNPESFKVDTDKEVIIVYTNVNSNKAEERVMSMYLKAGYKVKFAEKPETITVDNVREEMKNDKTALDTFNSLYSKKSAKNETAGFHKAMKYYNDWKKEQANKNANEESQAEE